MSEKVIAPVIDLNKTDLEIKAEMKQFLSKLNGLSIDELAEINNDFCTNHISAYDKFMTLLAEARMELKQLNASATFVNPRK